jgi:predicted transcriptional regulator
MQAATTIYIREDLKDRLNGLKHHPKESYNDVIERLVTLAVDDEPLSDEAIKGLEEALEDVKAKRLIPEEEIMKKYKVKGHPNKDAKD